MFTIMENRKRPRLELISSNNNNSNETQPQNQQQQGVAGTTTAMGTATLATIGGQSFILSNSNSSALPANILLSICDDNSDESEEFIIDHSMLTQIKQEQSVATQTSNQSPQLQQSQPATALLSTVPQFRIVNQAGKPLTSTLNNTTLINNSSLNNSMHLPPGCEIYVIKEVIDSVKPEIVETCNTTSAPKSLNANTTIKLEPMTTALPLLRHSNVTSSNLNINTTQNLNTPNSNNSHSLNNSSSLTSTGSNPTINSPSSSSSADDSTKRSLILEAYKKRDDKRRATHNEVERRRRDKINSWIFKLKEMLPSEITPSLNKDSVTSSLQQNSPTSRLLVQQPQLGSTTPTTRTPPSDSKSQILIKACEYIKSMQEEISSLRECLTENENLRLSNQRLQNEINSLRLKQQQQQKLHNNNHIILTATSSNSSNNSSTANNRLHHNNDDDPDDCEITLNSLNTTYANVQLFSPSSNQTSHHLSELVGLTTNAHVNNAVSPSSVNVTYAKRELIITDYVD